jgi:hypothetical protein
MSVANVCRVWYSVRGRSFARRSAGRQTRSRRFVMSSGPPSRLENTHAFCTGLAARCPGLRYAWLDGRAPGSTAIMPLPDWVLRQAVEEPARRGHPIAYWRRLVCDGVAAGERNNTIASLAGHLFRHGPTLTSRVRELTLPEDDEEADKFIRQAMLGQPELYFARLVIFGEGDSEAVALPRIASALGVDLDPSFVASRRSAEGTSITCGHSSAIWRFPSSRFLISTSAATTPGPCV